MFSSCALLQASFFMFSLGITREKLGKSKEITLGLRVFREGSLGLGNICKHLGFKPTSLSP